MPVEIHSSEISFPSFLNNIKEHIKTSLKFKNELDEQIQNIKSHPPELVKPDEVVEKLKSYDSALALITAFQADIDQCLSDGESLLTHIDEKNRDTVLKYINLIKKEKNYCEGAHSILIGKQKSYQLEVDFYERRRQSETPYGADCMLHLATQSVEQYPLMPMKLPVSMYRGTLYDLRTASMAEKMSTVLISNLERALCHIVFDHPQSNTNKLDTMELPLSELHSEEIQFLLLASTHNETTRPERGIVESLLLLSTPQGQSRLRIDETVTVINPGNSDNRPQ